MNKRCIFLGGGAGNKPGRPVNAGWGVKFNPWIFVVGFGRVFSILNSLSYRSFQCVDGSGQYA